MIALTGFRQDFLLAKVTVLDAGHFLQEECPAEVGRLLGAFFA